MKDGNNIKDDFILTVTNVNTGETSEIQVSDLSSVEVLTNTIRKSRETKKELDTQGKRKFFRMFIDTLCDVYKLKGASRNVYDYICEKTCVNTEDGINKL